MLLPNIVVRTVGAHIGVSGGVIWIAPFVVFPRGQRDGFIEHGGQHIHEGHCSDHSAVKFWRHVHHCTHEQPARTAPIGKGVFRSAITLTLEVSGATDEVRERIALVHQFPVLIPVPAEVLAASDVCNGVYIASVQ